jgi:hypothetical protein
MNGGRPGGYWITFAIALLVIGALCSFSYFKLTAAAEREQELKRLLTESIAILEDPANRKPIPRDGGTFTISIDELKQRISQVFSIQAENISADGVTTITVNSVKIIAEAPTARIERVFIPYNDSNRDNILAVLPHIAIACGCLPTPAKDFVGMNAFQVNRWDDMSARYNDCELHIYRTKKVADYGTFGRSVGYGPTMIEFRPK